MVVVDTNVLLDVVNANSAWLNWSAAQMIDLGKIHALIINPIIYAELSISFESIAEVEQSIADMGLAMEETPREVAFLAGKAFLQYRRNGGTRTNVLPDFFIGAHAAFRAASLLTRDARRYQAYFPTVRLITP
ncbi:type II toxin-antitoxin system VapC family toxin [Acidicapsa ligni]|uniref:type II toxin-antitoxin system VapC family toxin n=1 Tax=Acidicapsa ligni TaxID=542300 RepID=UPI0021DF6A74|nr:type II toxin-antitoxin system VapC family toxin [Acidicapsa ligni]